MSLVVVAAVRNVQLPTFEGTQSTTLLNEVSDTRVEATGSIMTIVGSYAPSKSSVETEKEASPILPYAARNTLLAVGGRVVASDDEIDGANGSVVTLLDGRTGELVRTEVPEQELDEDNKEAWRWWYRRHR